MKKNTKNIEKSKIELVDKLDIRDVSFKYKDKKYIL